MCECECSHIFRKCQSQGLELNVYLDVIHEILTNNTLQQIMLWDDEGI